MEVRALEQSLVKLSFNRRCCLLAGNASRRRQESSFRRTKKLLNVKPDDTFVFKKSTTKLDHVIFNPPSSLPSPHHTPLKFLPKDDKRRKLLESAAPSSFSHNMNPLKLPLASKALPASYQRHHLTEADVAEITRLRATDPELWTVNKLARKYNTTSVFIRTFSQNKEAHDKYKKNMADLWEKAGPRRKQALRDRARRWGMMRRDE